MRNIRVLVEVLPDTVPLVFADDRVPLSLRVVLDSSTNVANASADTAGSDAFPHRIECDLNQSLGGLRYVAKHECFRLITMPAVDDGREVDVDDVAIFQWCVVRNAVAHNLVHAGANHVRIRWSRRRAAVAKARGCVTVVSRVFFGQLVQLSGGRPDSNGGSQLIQQLRIKPCGITETSGFFVGSVKRSTSASALKHVGISAFSGLPHRNRNHAVGYKDVVNSALSNVESAAAEIRFAEVRILVMVERYRRGKKKRKLLGNHQKCWIWGRNLILETLRGQTWVPVDLLLSDELPGEFRTEAEGLADEQEIPIEWVSPERIRQVCGTGEHQGYAARMPEFPYAPPETLTELIERTQLPLIVMCDRIQDPFNFGAILRSADGFGVTAVVIPIKQQVGVTSLVARTSAGAVNHVPIMQVESLAETTDVLQSAGIAIVACSEKTNRPLSDCDFRMPAAIVLGNEGVGVSEEVLKKADSRVRIPLSGKVESLNAAVAAAIVMYEVSRQR